MNRLLFLGVGTIANAVQRALPGLPAAGTTRAAPDTRFHAIRPIAASDANAIRAAALGAQVVVSVPPDGHVDRAWSPLIAGAASIVYLSSTAVYPASAGVVTEASSVSASAERAALRLGAEQVWRDVGASVVRLPAFYGVATGLHVSLARGTFRMPGTGSNVVSRVHEDDAARFVCAALRAPPGSLLLAGDEQPSPVAEVVEFVCALFGLALPPSSEGDRIPLSLRASRSIDNRITRTKYAVELAYPSYREGYQSDSPDIAEFTRVILTARFYPGNIVFPMESRPSGYSAFSGERLIAFGSVSEVLSAVKAHLDTSDDPQLLIFEDRTGRQVEFDFRGNLEEVLTRALPPPERTGPGRPKLGVVSREVSLLPRHWQWLEAQPQGISAGLRRLVEEARKQNPGEQRARKGREALNKFMTAIAGNRPNYEEATRALFASDHARFEELIADWPEDIRAHLSRVLEDSLAPTADVDD